MKIEINKNEVYEIVVPSKMTIEEFYEFLSKLDTVAKIIKMNLVIGESFKDFKERYAHKTKLEREMYIATKTNKGHGGRPNPYFDTREKAMDIIQYYRHGTQEDRERISQIIGQAASEIGKRFHNLILRYSIQPSEVGFVRFANNKMKLSSIKEKDYVIKSYSGVFDEPEN